MAYTYTAAPTTAVVADLLATVGLSSLTTVAADLQAAYLAAAVQEIQQDTKRQFVPGSSDEVRYFDGSGTGLLVVDEYVDITAIEFLIQPQAAATNATNFVEVSTNLYPKTRLQIYQGAAHVTRGYLPFFPEGRANIKVTGTWGFSSSIPADVFMAMAKKAAMQMIDANQIATGGGLQLKQWTNADRSETFDTSKLASEIAGWQKDIDGVKKRYTRSLTEHRARTRPPLY